MKKLILVGLVFLTACAGGAPVSKSPVHRSETSKAAELPTAPPMSREKALGRQFIQAALKEFTFVTDYEVLTQVNEVSSRILEGIGEDPSKFHFFVVRQNQLNAFAVPGGYIFLFDGLLKELKTVDALAGVLAHEIAHVQRNHFFKDEKKMTAMSLATIASIILAGITGQEIGATGTIAAAANISMQLKFSRENEEDADIHAIEYLKRTSYDPSGLSEFFETLSFYAGFTRGVEPPYFSTHPGLGDRRFMVEALMKDVPKKQRQDAEPTKNWERDWQRLVAILKGENGAKQSPKLTDEAVLGEASDALRQLYLSALSMSRAGQLQEAAKQYQEVIRRDPDQAIYHADLSYVWMRLQEAALAKASALESLRLSKENPVPYLVLGMIAQSENDHKNALEYLETANKRAPDYAFVHLQLARSYHAVAMAEKEKFHLGRYHRLNLEPIKSIAQFQSALALLDPNSPLALRAKQEIEAITRDGV